jgi:Mce-associated membrane protein
VFDVRHSSTLARRGNSDLKACGMVNAGEGSVDAEVGTAEILAELAEVEAAEAEALAAAARAKATAVRLRESEILGIIQDGGVRRTIRRSVGLALGVLLICACATVSGLMLWQHEKVSKQHARDGEFVGAAENGVVALLSIDYNHAKADVQRIIDASTGSFRDDFTRDADSWVKTAEDSKTVTKGSISAAALESVTEESAVVLLAASSKVTNANGAQEDPRAWRMSVTVVRDGDRLKMSNVEFVP